MDETKLLKYDEIDKLTNYRLIKFSLLITYWSVCNNFYLFTLIFINVLDGLQLIYHTRFNEDYVIKNINLSIGSWIKDLGGIIDPSTIASIIMALSQEEQVKVLINYLIQKNNIKLYKTFIDLWKQHDEAKANQFEHNLKQDIENKGLSNVNEVYNIVQLCPKRCDLYNFIIYHIIFKQVISFN